ncbi:unnamed protein product, partial [Ectocarpus sp. 12 AP-2014]
SRQFRVRSHPGGEEYLLGQPLQNLGAGTNICRKSTNSWTAKAELPLEITLDV